MDLGYLGYILFNQTADKHGVHTYYALTSPLGINVTPLEHFIDDAPGSRRLDGIRLGETRCDDQGLPQSPGAAASPCAGVERKHCAEGFPAFAAKKRPSNGQIACRVADPQHSEIDDGAQSAGLHQEVSSADVAVDPHRRTLPGGIERRFPNFGGGLRIDLALQKGNRLARLSVIDRQRTTTMKVVRPGPRSVRRVDALQGDEKLREAGREGAQIADALRRGS